MRFKMQAQVLCCLVEGLAQFLICRKHCLKPFLCFFVSSLFLACSNFRTSLMISWNISSTHCLLAADVSKNGQPY